MNRQSFSKDPALAFGVAAKELANREVEANSLSHTWQIFESALVSAMHHIRFPSTEWAAG